jgi:hypothetical protein
LACVLSTGAIFIIGDHGAPRLAAKGHVMKRKLVVLCGLLLAGANAMACYTVYDAKSRIMYRGLEAPVDMSLQLREALATRFPAGSSMVFDPSPSCSPVGIAQVSRSDTPMVPPNTIRMERTGRQISPPSSAAPLFADPMAASAPVAPNMSVLGAGPARSHTVITEMRDPPVTIIQRGHEISVRRD